MFLSDQLQIELELQSDKHVFHVDEIIIHQLYVKGNRDQNDIALIKTDRPFDFAFRDKVSPICLPGMYFGHWNCTCVLISKFENICNI